MTQDRAATENRIDLEDDSVRAAAGIFGCLQMLVEEAATRGLHYIADALNVAMIACATESAEITDHPVLPCGSVCPVGTRPH